MGSREQRVRFQFLNKKSRSARHGYRPTFVPELEDPEPENHESEIPLKLTLCDDVLRVVLSYSHILDLLRLRKDAFFRGIIDTMCQSNPDFLHEIFIVNTGIADCRMLCRYDPRWFSCSLMTKLNIPLCA